MLFRFFLIIFLSFMYAEITDLLAYDENDEYDEEVFDYIDYIHHRIKRKKT